MTEDIESIKKRLMEIKNLEAQATPPPWSGSVNYPFYAQLDKPAPSLSKHDNERNSYWRVADASFVVSARKDVPWLVSRLEEAMKEIERLKEYEFMYNGLNK